ncbi:MAG: Ppx/GppA family phosphatase [Phycisphaeraceae bacterium]|nr:Ppx/GppA family phosphatase [Phycisphaerae bacterium]MBX3393584.1 Ppx/GppA family phosphatase [Phycisphaeraceae bacterium]
MKPRRFSVIDIGTNSARFLAVEMCPDGSWRPIAERREPCRLGEGLSVDSVLGDAPMERAVAAVAAFVAAAAEVEAPIVRAVATHAVRRARNREHFLSRVRESAGIEVEAIAPRVEGRLSYRAVTDLERSGERARLERIGVLDTGGGSVQVTVGVGDVAVASVSMPLGAVAITEMFGGPEVSSGERFEELREHIAAVVEGGLSRLPHAPRRLYGVGGGCTAAGELARLRAAGVLAPGGMPLNRPGRFRADITIEEARELIRALRPMGVAERAALPGLSVERSQIVVAGLAVLEAVLERLGGAGMTTLDVGLRDGLVIETAEQVRLRGAARSTATRLMLPCSAWALARRCRAEEPHSGHVARLAQRLHAELVRLARAGQVRRGRWCRRRGAAILNAAAVLHDSGICVSYKAHHKHSEEIIRFNGLYGVKHAVSDLVATVARYHRRAIPSRAHEAFGALDRKDRRLVRMLAGILRVADGLDRSHRQVVDDVRVTVTEDSIVVTASAEDEPRAELLAARAKADLLARTLRRAVSVEWRGPASKSGA